jgi:hypothetical protein
MWDCGFFEERRVGIEVPWLLHQAGINLRYLGKLHSLVTSPTAKMLLLIEVSDFLHFLT